MATEDSLSTQAAALAREIELKVGGLEDQDLFAVLGLTRSCTLDQILWAHETLTRWFDPGRLDGLGLVRLRPSSQRILDRLDYARWILSDETSRRAYEAQIDTDLEVISDIAA